MMRSKAHRKAGFTLMEMLIVVAIIAVLVAIAVPVFINQMDKAKAAVDMQNVRSAKSVATAQYMMSTPQKAMTYYFDAASGNVTSDTTAAASIKGYGKSAAEVEGAEGIPNKNGKANILMVTVAADGSCTAGWSGMGAVDSFLKKAVDTETSYGNKYHSESELISSVGSLPPIFTSDLFGDKKLYSGKNTLYWRPKTITVNGEKKVFLYAAGSASGNANWKGYALYYNGTVYRSTNINNYNKRIDENNVNFNSNAVGSDLEAYLLNNKWEKAQ